ncbi:hypothetical protein PGT21_013597 [Puccinia graminis f. sp. tritici]|uniref:Uncharacterized protein n=1 Tax=Puccinia graminis f. sp. tritici TaxID=56615 RepID=A0A5B0NY88_PUCGR|nr:hypothetical protein PGTUg99_014581 [Puccinia graminis f. sp. tritici]KAA1092768.1 hypothetical protein PGT21_013597 [Puccinia graminis f. sp. tritici]
MVSLAYLITLVAVLVAVSRADEVANAKTEQVDEKWIYPSYYRRGWWGGNGLSLYAWNPYLYSRYSTVLGQSCFGATFYPVNWGLGTRYFVKANDGEGAHSVTRRAIDLDDAEQLVRRDAGETVTCSAHGAAPQTFSLKECVEAVNQMSEKKLSTASHGGCKVALVSGNEKVAPGLISAKDLQAGVHNILNACANPDTKEAGTSKSGTKIDEKQVAMILTKN